MSTTTVGQDWDAETGHARRWTALAVLAAVAFMAQLDLFIVNVAVPAMSRSFDGASLGDLSWVLNAYAIVFAALLVPAGRLADHFGRRRFLLGGVALFTAGSVCCAASPTLPLLVASRVAQAAGAAAIVPASLGLLLPIFPARQHNLVVGIWAGVAAVAASSGAPLGGLLVGLSWRWIFLVNLPIGVFTYLLGRRVLPEIRAPAGTHLPDLTSVLALLAAVTLLVLGIVQGPSWGWASGAVIGLFAGALACAALTAWRAVATPNAVIEPSLFASLEFASAAVALLVWFVAFAAFLLITVLFLQDQWHWSALRTGLAIAPGPLTSAVFGINAGRITARIGRTIPAVLGTLCTAGAATVWLISATARPDYAAAILPGLFLAGAGAGLTQAPLFAAASTLAGHRTTTGSAVLNMCRQLGSAIGVAALVALLGSQHPHGLTEFHRGWILQIGAGLLATATILLARVRR